MRARRAGRGPSGRPDATPTAWRSGGSGRSSARSRIFVVMWVAAHADRRPDPRGDLARRALVAARAGRRARGPVGSGALRRSAELVAAAGSASARSSALGALLALLAGPLARRAADLRLRTRRWRCSTSSQGSSTRSRSRSSRSSPRTCTSTPVPGTSSSRWSDPTSFPRRSSSRAEAGVASVQFRREPGAPADTIRA